MKTYVIMISMTFPATHPKKGERTYFIEKIVPPNYDHFVLCCPPKIHTIRANYELWSKRIEEVQAGKAELSLRYWTGSPYNSRKDGSKQEEYLRLTKDHGVGIQKIEFDDFLYTALIEGKRFGDMDKLMENDGLNEKG